MKVTLRGEKSGFYITFFDYNDYMSLFGYKKLLNECYDCSVNDNYTFVASKFGGFFDNLPITSYSEVGVGEVGNTFVGNYFGSRILTINFKNSIVGNEISPNQILSVFTGISENLVMEVTTDRTYTLICHFTNDTSIENGVLVLESSFVNGGSYWSAGNKIDFNYFYDTKSYIPKSMPQILLNPDWYPYKKQIIAQAIFPINLEIGGSKFGTWQKLRIKSDNNELFFDPPIKYTKIVIDSINSTITDGNGNDLSQYITIISGNFIYFYSKVGINNFEIIVDENTSSLITLPTDMYAKFTYEELYASIGGSLTCNS